MFESTTERTKRRGTAADLMSLAARARGGNVRKGGGGGE